jgi:uncharacterized protein
MRILVDRLSTTPTLERFEGDPAFWERACALVPELASRTGEPFAFEVRAHRMGQDVYLEGTAQGTVELECGRCLARYRHAIREPFRLVLEPAGDRLPAEPEAAAALARDGMCLGDEFESGWFQGPEIDLAAFFREVLALALPVQPVCREDCLGLCPRCGVDRNRESCGCAEAARLSPFAVLGKLKREQSRGGH